MAAVLFDSAFGVAFGVYVHRKHWDALNEDLIKVLDKYKETG